MKKILVFACMMLMSTAMFAQSDSKMSARIGVGMSTFSGSDVEDAKSAFSYKIGVDYKYNITENFALIPGIEIANKAVKNEHMFDGTCNIFYAQIPVFAAYSFPISDGMSLAVKAGPYVNFGLFSSEVEESGVDKKYSAFDEEGGNFNRFNAGIIAGLALDMGKYVISAEFSRGLTKTRKGYDGEDAPKCYQMCYGLTFGYKF